MTFHERYNKAKEQLNKFVAAMRSTDDAVADEAVVEIVEAAGVCLLGMWRELHRIADALQKGPGDE